MKQPLTLLLLGLTALHHQAQALPQQQHQRNRPTPALSFQTFDYSPGFTRTGIPSIGSPLPDIASQFSAQLSSAASPSSPEVQEQPTRRDNEVTSLPLYKQSYPGVYVKGHATESLNKYEPTRQVAHHHGPNYRFPTGNIASSPPLSSSSSALRNSIELGNDFTGGLFSSFKNS